jgi:hypothetical protein
VTDGLQIQLSNCTKKLERAATLPLHNSLISINDTGKHHRYLQHYQIVRHLPLSTQKKLAVLHATIDHDVPHQVAFARSINHTFNQSCIHSFMQEEHRDTACAAATETVLEGRFALCAHLRSLGLAKINCTIHLQ